MSEFYWRLWIALWLESNFSVQPTSQVAGASFDLNHSYDSTVRLDSNQPFPVLSTTFFQCLKKVIVHVLLDPAVSHQCLNSNNVLTPAMTILQVYYYNFVRASFRQASLHRKADTTFETTLHTWLLWLEPWNRTDRTLFCICIAFV